MRYRTLVLRLHIEIAIFNKYQISLPTSRIVHRVTTQKDKGQGNYHRIKSFDSADSDSDKCRISLTNSEEKKLYDINFKQFR